MTAATRDPKVEQFRQDVYDLLAPVDPVAAQRYEDCGKEGRGWYYHCPDYEEHYSKYIPCSCMLRICPECADRLSGRVKDKYRKVIEAITQRPNPRRWSLKFVTLTRHVGLADDPGGIARQVLDEARDTYYQLWAKDKGAGMIAFLEVGENGHKYHVHCIVWGRYIDQHEVSFTWEAFTGDRIVDIGRITVDRAVREGMKYVTKFTNLSPRMLVDLHMALKGTRRVRSYGCFYNPQIDEEAEELPDVDCPECGAQLKFTSELDYERWRSGRIDVRREWLARQSDVLAALVGTLNLTGANKSPPDQAPQDQKGSAGGHLRGQITFFDDDHDPDGMLL